MAGEGSLSRAPLGELAVWSPRVGPEKHGEHARHGGEAEAA